MYNISAEIVTANYFAETESNELPLSKLGELKREIEKEFSDKFLFVDTTWESISSAVYSNSRYFKFNDSNTSILFIAENKELFYEDVYGIFNSKIDLDIKFFLLVFLENLLQTN